MSALSHVIMTLSVIYEGLVDLYSEQCRILSRSSHHLLFLFAYFFIYHNGIYLPICP